jgi:opacity protein-like surface antigen
MNKSLTSCIIALAFLSASSVAAAPQKSSDDFSTQWDSAVSSLLLAAGMYGSTDGSPEGVGFTVERSKDLFKGLAIEEDKLNGQNITLSYNGSSGKLGFSAGYIYTSVRDNQEPDALFLDLDSTHENPYSNNNPWFLALNMSTSFQVNDAFSVGFGSRAMLMKNPFEDHDGRVLSMLLNLPMSYKNYFTITPELQWSRALPGNNSQSVTQNSSDTNSAAEKDVFYGGMSITFSY